MAVQEHHVGNKKIVISDTNMKQVVYIYKCVDSTVQIKGKVNNVTVGKKNMLPNCILLFPNKNFLNKKYLDRLK